MDHVLHTEAVVEGETVQLWRKKLRGARIKKDTPSKKRNSERHVRRTYKSTQEEGLRRRNERAAKKRASYDVAPETETQEICGMWLQGTAKRPKPHSGIQRPTPKPVLKTKPRQERNLEAIEQSRASHRDRVLMRQIKKIAAFAKRCGKDAEAIRIYLVEKFLNSKTEVSIPVGKYQRLILQDKGVFL